MLHTVEGIVIRGIDYGESNKIITLYTPDKGKVAVMARGAKKLGSRHSAITQLFTHGYYTYFQSRPGSMGTLNGGEIVSPRHSLREKLDAMAYSSYLAEMTDRILGELDASAYLFGQLSAALNAIEEGKDSETVTHVYEMKMLEAAGYAPVLAECVSCGEKLPAGEKAAGWGVSAAAGGTVCRRCRTQLRDPHFIQADGTVLKLLGLYQRLDLRRLGKIELKKNTRAQIRQCIRLFFDTHLGIQWRSRQFLDQMDNIP